LAAQTNSINEAFWTKYTSGGTNALRRNSIGDYYVTWPNPADDDDAGYLTYTTSFYAVYTPSGASCPDVTHSLTSCDTTHTSVGIINDLTIPAESTLVRHTLIWDDDNNIAAPIDSIYITTGFTDPDTLYATGLTASTAYYFWWVTTKGTCKDTSAYHTLTTEGTPSCYNVTHTLLCTDTTSTTIKISDDYNYDPDSTLNLLRLIWDDDASIVAPIDSVSITSSFTDPYTLQATGLTPETAYYLWFIVGAGTCKDTSSSITRTTEATPPPSGNRVKVRK